MKHPAIFDAHLHIIDGKSPLKPNDGYLPQPFLCTEYQELMQGYRVLGGVVVSGSFQAFDQTYLIRALNDLGSSYVGVTQLPASVTDNELISLHDAGVRGVRFNLRRGGSEQVSHLKSMALRLYELVGWHVELYVDSSHLEEIYPTLAVLPAVSIDHLGLSEAGQGTLLKLVKKGVKVKATGFGRVRLDIKKVLRACFDENPSSLMFGTDLPGTRSPVPFLSEHIDVIVDAIGPKGLMNVFFENARKFYRLRTEANGPFTRE